MKLGFYFYVMLYENSIKTKHQGLKAFKKSSLRSIKDCKGNPAFIGFYKRMSCYVKGCPGQAARTPQAGYLGLKTA